MEDDECTNCVWGKVLGILRKYVSEQDVEVKIGRGDLPGPCETKLSRWGTITCLAHSVYQRVLKSSFNQAFLVLHPDKNKGLSDDEIEVRSHDFQFLFETKNIMVIQAEPRETAFLGKFFFRDYTNFIKFLIPGATDEEIMYGKRACITSQSCIDKTDEITKLKAELKELKESGVVGPADEAKQKELEQRIECMQKESVALQLALDQERQEKEQLLQAVHDAQSKISQVEAKLQTSSQRISKSEQDIKELRALLGQKESEEQANKKEHRDLAEQFAKLNLEKLQSQHRIDELEGKDTDEEALAQMQQQFAAQLQENKQLERENTKLNRKLHRAEEENKTQKQDNREQAQELHQTNKELDQAQKRQRKEDKGLESALNASGKFFDKESKLREKYSQEARLNMIQRSLSKELQKFVLGDTGYVNISAFLKEYASGRGKFHTYFIRDYAGDCAGLNPNIAAKEKLIYRLSELSEELHQVIKSFKSIPKLRVDSFVAPLANFVKIDTFLTQRHDSAKLGAMLSKEKTVKHNRAFM